MFPEVQQHISDAELLQSMRRGDTSAFKALYDKYWENLYVKACKRVNEDDAKDLVQEVMTTLWRRRNVIFTYEDGEIGRYLYTALKYRIISYYAYKNSEVKRSALFDMSPDDVSAKILEIKELKELIESEVKRLPVKMQQIFRMSREDNSSISDIARTLNLSEQTVKNQLTEALKRLRISLQSQTSAEWMIIHIILLFYINK